MVQTLGGVVPKHDLRKRLIRRFLMCPNPGTKNFADQIDPINTMRIDLKEWFCKYCNPTLLFCKYCNPTLLFCKKSVFKNINR